MDSRAARVSSWSRQPTGPDVLDPALLRPDRFDRQVVVGLPDVEWPRADTESAHAQIALADDVDRARDRQRTPDSPVPTWPIWSMKRRC